jgi:hypothetical protein
LGDFGGGAVAAAGTFSDWHSAKKEAAQRGSAAYFFIQLSNWHC